MINVIPSVVFKNEKVISLQEAADILGMKYHTARQRIQNEKRISYFEYLKNVKKTIKVVEKDVKQYKRNAYIKPTNKQNNKIINIDVADLKTITIKNAAQILQLGYLATYNRIKSNQEIGYFDYDGIIAVVEQDIYDYQFNHLKNYKEYNNVNST